MDFDLKTSIAAFAAVITIAGWVIVHRLTRHRDSRNRSQAARDEFQAIIGSQLAKLELMDSTLDEPAFFLQSRAIIGDAVHKVRPVLDSVEWARLNALWDQYRAQSYGEDATRQLAGEFDGKPNQRERLGEALKEFRQAVE